MDKPVAAVAGDAAAGRDAAWRLPTVRHRGLPPRFYGFPLYVARRWLEPGRAAGPGPFPSKALGATAPQGAIAPRDHRQTIGVARHALVLRQLELLLGLVPALSALAHPFHFRGGLLIQR